MSSVIDEVFHIFIIAHGMSNIADFLAAEVTLLGSRLNCHRLYAPALAGHITHAGNQCDDVRIGRVKYACIGLGNLTNAVYLVGARAENGSIGDCITIFQRVDIAEVAVAAAIVTAHCDIAVPAACTLKVCRTEPHIGNGFAVVYLLFTPMDGIDSFPILPSEYFIPEVEV